MDNELYIGQKVRSFDFPRVSRDTEGPDANFIEGEVLEIVSGKEAPDTCTSFKISVTRAVCEGEEVEAYEIAYVPINGLVSLFGGERTTDGVEMLEDIENNVKVGDIDITFIHSVNAYRNGSYLGSFDTFEDAVDWFSIPANQSYRPNRFANA